MITKDDWNPENASLKISIKFAIQGLRQATEAFTFLIGSVFVLTTAIFKQMARIANKKEQEVKK